MSADKPALTDQDYEQLLALRDELRRFLRWSEEQARGLGITPAQHQLLLAVRGHRGDPTVGEIAEHLLLRHNSTVELLDRAERAGLVGRHPDPGNHRTVHIRLTADGEHCLATLAAVHLDELGELRARFVAGTEPT